MLLLGHEDVFDQFRRRIARGRLASTFLFIGPAGIGKRTAAMKLAQAFLCDRNPEAELRPCEQCESCRLVEAGTHPDLVLISKPEDRSFIPVEAFIGDREHRMREGLCHDVSLKPYRGGRKIAIIDDADYMNQEGANSLLKTLEEPPPKSILILIGTSEQKQLPTIRSRCQMVRFQPLPTAHVAQLLQSQGLVTDAGEAERLARLSHGSLQRALELADPALDEFRSRLFEALGQGVFQSVPFAKELTEFVDSAGKEAPPRRARFRQVIGFAADFYRALILGRNGLTFAADDALARAVEIARFQRIADDEAVAACVERCLDALAQIDANANLTTLMECWLDDLVDVVQKRGTYVS